MSVKVVLWRLLLLLHRMLILKLLWRVERMLRRRLALEGHGVKTVAFWQNDVLVRVKRHVDDGVLLMLLLLLLLLKLLVAGVLLHDDVFDEIVVEIGDCSQRYVGY